MCSKLKIIGVFLFVFCFDSPNANGEIRFADRSKCSEPVFTTSQYAYTRPFPIDKIQNESGIFLNFFVKGDRDAHIIFSPTVAASGNGDQAYEIVLGSDGNEESVIRAARNGDLKKASSETEDKPFLDINEWKEFWINITWNATNPNSTDTIKVGKGNNNAFMNWTAPNHLKIVHYGFAGFRNSKVNWTLPCSQKIKTETELRADIIKNHTESVSLGPANITFESSSANVNGLSLDINARISITWKDDKFHWNASEADVKELRANLTTARKHNVTIQGIKLVDTDEVTITSNGTVTWMANRSIPLESCLPKGDSPNRPLLKCPIELTFSGKNVTFNATNIPSPSGVSSQFNLVKNVTLISVNTTINLNYTMHNRKQIKDPNRPRILIDLQNKRSTTVTPTTITTTTSVTTTASTSAPDTLKAATESFETSSPAGTSTSTEISQSKEQTENPA